MGNSTNQVLSICTIQQRSGRFCEAPAHPDAPYPICGRHLAALGAFAIETARVSERRNGAPGSLVYYVRIQDFIKIGRSTNVAKRIRDFRLPPTALLAVEPGGPDIENERHQQFAHLNDGSNGFREHFTLKKDLVDHVNALRAEYGVPNLTKIDRYQRSSLRIEKAPRDLEHASPVRAWKNTSRRQLL